MIASSLRWKLHHCDKIMNKKGVKPEKSSNRVGFPPFLMLERCWVGRTHHDVLTRFLFRCTEYCFWTSCLLSIKHIWYGYHLEILNLKQKKHDASTYLEISPREVFVRLQGQGCHAGSEGGCTFYGEDVIDDVDNDGDDGVDDDVRDDNRPQGVKLLSKLWGL